MVPANRGIWGQKRFGMSRALPHVFSECSFTKQVPDSQLLAEFTTFIRLYRAQQMFFMFFLTRMLAMTVLHHNSRKGPQVQQQQRRQQQRQRHGKLENRQPSPCRPPPAWPRESAHGPTVHRWRHLQPFFCRGHYQKTAVPEVSTSAHRAPAGRSGDSEPCAPPPPLRRRRRSRCR